MKCTTKKLFVVLAMTTAFAGAPVFAQTPPSTENHEAHHPEGQAPTKTGEQPADGGMMSGMKMDDMHGMMRDCMGMHKDGKMCEHQTMKKCEASMKKGDCQKMMKEAKTKEKQETQDKKAKNKK